MNEQVAQAAEEKKMLAQEAANFIQHPFWKHILNVYIADKIKSFTNDAILNGFKDMEEFKERRGVVKGLRDMVGEINSLVEYGRQPIKPEGK